MAAVDGHGNAINFRSANGSKFAVDAGIKVLLNIIIAQGSISLDNISSFKDMVYSTLPRAVSNECEHMVDVDIAKNPLLRKKRHILKQN